MELLRTRISPSPLAPDRVRLEADVVADGFQVPDDVLWFDVSDDLSGSLAGGGDPWLVALAPAAAMTGETLRIPLPVDPGLLADVRATHRRWKERVPRLHLPDIHVGERESDAAGREAAALPEPALAATPGPAGAAPAGRRVGGPAGRGDGAAAEAARAVARRDGRAATGTACFYAGDVESLFTLLRHSGGAGAVTYDLEELVCLWGLDHMPSRPDLFRRFLERGERVAASLGIPAVGMATNLGGVRWPDPEGGRLSRGARLAAAALALEGRWERVLLPARIPDLRGRSLEDGDVFAGLPLAVDGTRLVPDGAHLPWTDKMALVARSPVGRWGLRVCWRATDADCGRCFRCLHAMAAIEIVGTLHEFRTLPWERFSPVRLSRLHVAAPTGRRKLARTIPYAVVHGRNDVAGALRRCVKRSERRLRRVALLRWLRRTARRVSATARELLERVRPTEDDRSERSSARS